MGRIARWRERRAARRRAHALGKRLTPNGWPNPPSPPDPAKRPKGMPPPPSPTQVVELSDRRVGRQERLRVAKEDLDKALEEHYLKDREECWEEAKRRKQGKDKTRLLFVDKMAKRGWTAAQVEQCEAALTDG